MAPAGRAGTAAINLLLRRARWLQAALAVIVLLIAVLIPQDGSAFYTALALNILVFGLLAMSLDLMGGYTGLVSLGQAAFLGVGAYGIAVAEARGLGAWPAIGIALLGTAVVAAVFGIIAVRVSGITFVILTLALGQVIWGLAYRDVSISGGDNGLSIAARPEIGPVNFTDPVAYYYFTLVVVVACALLLRAIVHSPFGLSLRGIRDNEARMRTLGYNVLLHKYIAFFISGLFGGIAGILFAFYNLYMSPTAIDFSHNGSVVLMAVVGGLGTLWGAIVGALVVVVMQQWVSIYFARWETLLGIIFVLTMLFARQGIWGSAVAGFQRLAKLSGAAEAVLPKGSLRQAEAAQTGRQKELERMERVGRDGP
ncbi:MAG: branched-chain amino acid ABC transporter permease [Candidatus Dormibacterales bacterium]